MLSAIFFNVIHFFETSKSFGAFVKAHVPVIGDQRDMVVHRDRRKDIKSYSYALFAPPLSYAEYIRPLVFHVR